MQAEVYLLTIFSQPGEGESALLRRAKSDYTGGLDVVRLQRRLGTGKVA